MLLLQFLIDFSRGWNLSGLFISLLILKIIISTTLLHGGSFGQETCFLDFLLDNWLLVILSSPTARFCNFFDIILLINLAFVILRLIDTAVNCVYVVYIFVGEIA